MANRSFVKDVLQALQEVDEAFVGVTWTDAKELHAAMARLWKVVGGLESVALRRANTDDYEWYSATVLTPRAKRIAEMTVELVPAPRTDKNGVAW